MEVEASDMGGRRRVRSVRLIARLDIKGENLIKGVHLEGLRTIGDPSQYAQKYYRNGIDELVFIDCVASLYGRNNLGKVIMKAATDVFVPITVGGGVRSVCDARELLSVGADKVAINTAAVSRPALISELAQEFGSQCVVVSIQAKRVDADRWEVFTDNGRERAGYDVLDWVSESVDLGAGEVLLTSIDQEGTRRGFDLELLKRVVARVPVPVVASGGMGAAHDIVDAVVEGGVDAVAMADILHYGRATVGELREYALKSGLRLRNDVS